MQCVRNCPRAASARGPKAVSQPSSLCSGNGASESCRVGWAIGGSNSRSPLVVRLTEIVMTAALSAVTGLTSVLMPPAVRALKRQAEAIFLSLSSNLRCIACLRRHSLWSFQKEKAFNISSPTNTADSHIPNSSVVMRSFTGLSFPIHCAEGSARRERSH